MTDKAKRAFFTRFSGKSQNNVNNEPLPWLVNASQFHEQCIRCNKCIDVCETKIITHGDGGFPIVDFSKGECTFCYSCASVCPEPLFDSKATLPWQAEISIKDSCLAKKNVECRSCMENCEPMAITFKLSIGSVAQPSLDSDSCTGCGACVAVCPSDCISISLARA
jgi:ferredoxin-type protein NapF